MLPLMPPPRAPRGKIDLKHSPPLCHSSAPLLPALALETQPNQHSSTSRTPPQGTSRLTCVGVCKDTYSHVNRLVQCEWSHCELLSVVLTLLAPPQGRQTCKMLLYLPPFCSPPACPPPTQLNSHSSTTVTPPQVSSRLIRSGRVHVVPDLTTGLSLVSGRMLSCCQCC